MELFSTRISFTLLAMPFCYLTISLRSIAKMRLALLLAATWGVGLTAGCSSSGIYSVRHHDQAFAPQSVVYDEESFGTSPCGPCPGVSLCDAVKSFCGPPELFHGELMHGDPGAIVAPTPKYHPLPTRPVFEPAYFPPAPQSPELDITPPQSHSSEAVAASSAKWRGPLPRMAPAPPAEMEPTRVARHPLENVTFPPLQPWRVPPERITPGESHPLR